MKAYLHTHHGSTGSWVDVVTEDDYDNRGPHAHSHRTQVEEDSTTAKVKAEAWAKKNGYTVVAGPEAF